MFGWKKKRELRCSFCNKSQRDVRKLIAGPSVYICDECVQICIDIIGETRKGAVITDGAPDNAQGPPAPVTAVLCALCRFAQPWDRALLVEGRGVVCAACVDAIQIAVATRQRDIT